MDPSPQSSTATLPTLLLFPFNGNALEALDCAAGSFEVIGFVDDSPDKIGQSCNGIPVLTRAAFDRWPDAKVLAVPGSPRSFRERRGIIEGLRLAPGRFARVVHGRARISPLATVGENVLVMAGVVVTSNANIGSNVCILPNTVVHHDVAVGTWSLIGSNVTLAGHVIVGENCYVGSGTSVRDGITIGEQALIGLGSTVTRNVAPHTRVAGSPARLLPASD